MLRGQPGHDAERAARSAQLQVKRQHVEPSTWSNYEWISKSTSGPRSVTGRSARCARSTSICSTAIWAVGPVGADGPDGADLPHRAAPVARGGPAVGPHRPPARGGRVAAGAAPGRGDPTDRRAGAGSPGRRLRGRPGVRRVPVAEVGDILPAPLLEQGRSVVTRSCSRPVYWAQPSWGHPHQEFRVDEATFDFWHRLSRAANYAAVLALTEEPSNPPA